MEDDMIESINHACSGSAICFLGAGFSALAMDSSGEKNVPSSVDLTQELWELAETPAEAGATLTDIADFFEAKGKQDVLRRHLLKRLTLCNPSAIQRTVLSVPWRAIFTTNFDDVVERAIPENARQTISPAKAPSFIRTDVPPLYYLHGRALDVLETNADPGIVLSERNYLEIKARNADLYATFINETQAASRIFFIGYSIRDAEIASRIFSLGETLRRKSIVICRGGEGAIAVARLEKFGKVLPVGVEGLAASIDDVRENAPQLGEPSLTFLVAEKSPTAKAEVSKEDVDRLMLTGEFDAACYLAQRNGLDPSNIYCIDYHDKFADIYSALDNQVSRFLVTADLGNGKSIFLKQLSVEATARGHEVYVVTSALPEIFQDIDKY